MSPYYIKEVVFLDGRLKIVIGNYNDDNIEFTVCPCADEILNKLYRLPKESE